MPPHHPARSTRAVPAIANLPLLIDSNPRLVPVGQACKGADTPSAVE